MLLSQRLFFFQQYFQLMSSNLLQVAAKVKSAACVAILADSRVL